MFLATHELKRVLHPIGLRSIEYLCTLKLILWSMRPTYHTSRTAGTRIDGWGGETLIFSVSTIFKSLYALMGVFYSPFGGRLSCPQLYFESNL